MARPLDDYGKKRDFERTPEPPPRPGRRRKGAAWFVVHRHAATRLHYDLRLEMRGVLCSWAVPKGFSYEPRDKHLAIRTEDHPLEYVDFHGVIPEGQYGAGSMTIWDRGTYEVLVGDAPSSVAKGELKLVMKGRKLRGEFHLVRTQGRAASERSAGQIAGGEGGKEHWLVFKSRDRYAGGPARDSMLGVDLTEAVERALPRTQRLLEPVSIAEPFDDPGWLYEMAFAGRRALLEKHGERVRLRGLADDLPAQLGLTDAFRALRAETALVDGVLVALDAHDRPSRAALAERLAGRGDAPVAYYAFDLLHWEELDLRALGTLERKSALRAVLPGAGALHYVDHVVGAGQALADAVRAAGLDGVVAKRIDAQYEPARDGTSDAWRRFALDPAATAPSVPLAEALARRPGARRRSRVKLTNLDKVYWPAEGYTKGDLVAWYESIAELLLPYLRDRPVHMERRPDGIDGKSFYQRQAKEDLPDWVETIPIEHGGETTTQIVCNDRDTLLWLANQGSIDLHPWLSRKGSLDEPDVCVIDVDAKESPFADALRVAEVTGRILREVGLAACVKTSGKSGLHVFVPLAAGYTYDQSRMFAEAIARAVVRELPDIATVARTPGARGGRVYVDFLQNRRSQTIVPPYVPRPVAGAPVSTPLAWDELASLRSPKQFTIRTLPARLAEVGDLFAPTLGTAQDLMPAIEALSRRYAPQ